MTRLHRLKHSTIRTARHRCQWMSPSRPRRNPFDVARSADFSDLGPAAAADHTTRRGTTRQAPPACPPAEIERDKEIDRSIDKTGFRLDAFAEARRDHDVETQTTAVSSRESAGQSVAGCIGCCDYDCMVMNRRMSG